MEEEGSFWDGAGDTVSSLLDTYLTFRTAEAQADAIGAGQAQLNTQVEQQQGNGQVPLSAEQLQSVTANRNSVGGFSQTQLLIGAGALALVFLIAKK